jgi:hypothetical protein
MPAQPAARLVPCRARVEVLGPALRRDGRAVAAQAVGDGGTLACACGPGVHVIDSAAG